MLSQHVVTVHNDTTDGIHTHTDMVQYINGFTGDAVIVANTWSRLCLAQTMHTIDGAD